MTLSSEDQAFLKTYDDSKYAKPSVTADIVIFSYTRKPDFCCLSDDCLSDGSIQVLLIRRGKSPYKDQFALPGGFVEPDESVDDAAQRELMEETGIVCTSLEPIRTFSAPDRDPRRWVISCAYLALVDASLISVQADDDAKDAQWFQIFLTKEKDGQWNLELKNTSEFQPFTIHLRLQETTQSDANSLLPPATHLSLTEHEHGLAFDHGEILGYAIQKLLALAIPR